jgi:GNAT superfamily N-acetyltransferase
MNNFLSFEPISDRNLEVALEVARGIFPYEVNNGKLTFEDDAYRDSIAECKSDFSYSLVRESGVAVGLTGWYREDDGTMWLGWFGVVRSCRGRGLGTQILRMTADIVAGFGVKEMFIYSGQRREEHAAHRLYTDNGFINTGLGIVNEEPVLFFRGSVPIVATDESKP